jgi:peptidylprolyl isomerase
MRSLGIVLIVGLVLVACGPAQTAPTQLPGLLLPTPIAGATTEPTPAPAASPAGAQTAWSSAPDMTIDPDTIYLARFTTEAGDIVVELLADKAPLTVNNFIFLARAGYYDNTTFHRVLAGFMAQGGDPTGTGRGGPGYTFRDEIHPDLRFDEAGLLAMANSGAHTNGSQFFITTAPAPHLTGRHTIFGKVIEGMETVLALRLRDPQENPSFLGDALFTVEIVEATQSSLPPPTATAVPIVPVPEDGRPLAARDPAARENLFNGPPVMSIDTSADYIATVETTRGDVVVRLFAAEAPLSVNNFVVLANLGYWDNFPIAFVAPDEFALTGSPGGRPDSDIGYWLPWEGGRQNVAGSVGYWYRDDVRASSGSQIYFLLADNAFMDSDFTVFGEIITGLAVVALLTEDDVIVRVTVAAP